MTKDQGRKAREGKKMKLVLKTSIVHRQCLGPARQIDLILVLGPWSLVC
jgi:hypothetical protein